MTASLGVKSASVQHLPICLIEDCDIQQSVVGGGRRRQRVRSGGRRGRASSIETTVTNLFYQINISFFFIFGGDNHSIYSLQSNAADNEVYVKALSV
jgi:hypothetical protein